MHFFMSDDDNRAKVLDNGSRVHKYSTYIESYLYVFLYVEDDNRVRALSI